MLLLVAKVGVVLFVVVVVVVVVVVRGLEEEGSGGVNKWAQKSFWELAAQALPASLSIQQRMV
jgi:hypothetical protein